MNPYLLTLLYLLVVIRLAHPEQVLRRSKCDHGWTSPVVAASNIGAETGTSHQHIMLLRKGKPFAFCLTPKYFIKGCDADDQGTIRTSLCQYPWNRICSDPVRSSFASYYAPGGVSRSKCHQRDKQCNLSSFHWKELLASPYLQARICSAFWASSRIPGASTGGSMSTSRTDSSPLLFVELIVVGRCLECQCRNRTATRCFSSMTTIVLNTTLNAFVPLATSPISLNSFLYALI